MSKVQRLEQEVRALSADELTHFRRWFDEFDALSWDRQIEDDVASGKLDGLADAALDEHARGKATDPDPR